MGAFKAYDIRGLYPSQVNEELAYEVGKATATFLNAKDIVVGRDCRISSKPLFDALIKGILETGTNVIDLGLISTPQLYFSLYTSDIDGGIMITASHNSKEYNGFKICSKGAHTIFKDNGFDEIQQIIASKKFKSSKVPGEIVQDDIQALYLQYFSNKGFPLSRKWKLAVDLGNGMGSYDINVLRKIFGPQLELDVLFEEMDGTFPNHQANPIIEKNMTTLKEKLQNKKYDFGIGFDGDADRIAFFLSDGTMVPGDLMIGVLGSRIAKKGEKVGFEVRTSQAVKEILEKKKIIPLLYPSGRSYIIDRMRRDDAIFAGEKSGHYFYKELAYTDSPLMTVINMLKILDNENHNLEEDVQPLIEKYFSSGEINYDVSDPDKALKTVEDFFFSKADKVLKIDGVSVYTEFYFFNIRKSNTESLVRLNIEGNSPQIVEEIKEQIEKLIL